MDWLRYSGRIILAAGTIVIGLWATHEHLLHLPTYQFWLGILCYLLVAEIVWTLVQSSSPHAETGLARQGLRRITRQGRRPAGFAQWLYDGGRVRVADIAGDHDVVRDAHQGLLTAVLTREAGPRVHLLTGDPGTGRSALLLRLGRALAEQGQTVFLALATVDLPGLPLVIDTAKRGQVYLLLDDLDLRPQAEAWLYDVMRAGLPVVIVATVRTGLEPAVDDDGLAALRPAGFLSQATRHRPQITANDLAALVRKLALLSRQRNAGLAVEAAPDLVIATRLLQGREPRKRLWQDLDNDPSLPLQQKIIIALCGVAELGLPEGLCAAVLGDKALPRWGRAGLLVVEDGLALPPHCSTCLYFLKSLENPQAAVHGALQSLGAATEGSSPRLLPRLLFGLGRCEETAALARGFVQSLRPAPPQGQWPEDLRRLWRQVLEILDLPTEVALAVDSPPELSLQCHLAFDRTDYQAALELSHRLGRNAIYQGPARFNAALALAHLGLLTEAEAELTDLPDAPPGTSYLRGVIAEAKGDYVKALDAFEVSRKADELQQAATRHLAHCYVRSGAPRAALPLFEAALSYSPLRPDLYGGLAVAHLHAGMAQRASAQSARAIQAGVDPSAARKAVARACSEAHAYDRAATELEACVAFAPTDLEAWRDLAAACRWLGRFEREEECLRRLELSDSHNPAVHYEMALCQRDQGRFEEAARLLAPLVAKALADDDANAPLAVPVLLLAAELACTQGGSQRQRELATKAIELGEASGWGQYWLADSYGEGSEEAQAAYGRAVAVFLETLTEGTPPRRAAQLWQAVYLVAVKLGDDSLAAKAERRARHEVSVCEALGAEIESVHHHRAVPSDVFLESLPGKGLSDPQPKDDARNGASVEAPIIRTRFSGRASGRGQ